jgi:vacuolar-type H+-ATPase subunit I/STV1
MLVNITVTVENVANHKKVSKTVENVVASFTRSSVLMQATDVKCYFHKQNEKTLNHQYDKIDSTEISLLSLTDDEVKTDETKEVKAETVQSEVKANTKEIVSIFKTDSKESEAKTEIKKILSKKEAKKALAKALRK